MSAQVETHSFQTEVKQLLHLMIHALYSNQEIFLRELVSNASDALDKLRFEAIAKDDLYEGDGELGIWLDYDKETNTLTLRDNGIGMSRDEVIENIGTIASSGTKKFLQSLSGDQAKDSHLIGQFGVGFYSAFIVADKVTLETRRAGYHKSEGVRWESSGEGDYTLETIDRELRGTTITLHLKEDAKEFAESYRLKNIIKTYSNHLSFPIYLPKTEWKEGNETKLDEWEKANDAGAMWTKSKSDLTDEDYQEFYKSQSFGYDEPLTYSHNRVEGTTEYTSLLYIPTQAPFDLWDRDRRYGLKLYVKRVFIMDDAEHLMPNYLRFVRGIIDSDDLPLNVSREILQNNKVIERIKSANIKRVLSMIEGLAKEEDQSKFEKFWDTFGQVMKEGVVEDFANKERLAKILRFASTTSEAGAKQRVSLEDYVSRMVEGQDSIYYITGETFAAAKASPHLEVFRKAGVEVLVMYDRIDEWLVSHLHEFEGKTLKSVTRGDLDDFLKKNLEADVKEEDKEKANDLAKRIGEALGEQVKEVRLTYRLVDSPACLVADESDMNANMQRIMKELGQSVPMGKPILEINPDHKLVKRLEIMESGQRFNDWAALLFEQAQLAEGAHLESPGDFVRRLNQLLTETL